MNNKLVESLIRRYDGLAGARANFEVLWDDVVDYTMPDRSRTNQNTTPGEKRDSRLSASAPVRGLERLAANLHAMLTNPSIQWFSLATDNEDANKADSVKRWLELVGKVSRDALDNSNFDLETQEMYSDLCGLGTGVLFVEDGIKVGNDLNFKSQPPTEVHVAEDSTGRVDSVFSKRLMSARQMVQRWGKKAVGPEVTKTLDAAPDDLREVLHVVCPREDVAENGGTPDKFVFGSYWIDMTTRRMVHESGFQEFPYCVPRWRKSSGETYGRSPVITNLADIKSLNVMRKTLLRTGQLIAEPPLNVPDDNEKPKLTPGGINYYQSGTNDRVEPIALGANLPYTFDMEQTLTDGINDGLFVSRLQLVDAREMTAEEVRQRTAENMRVLGPTFGRLQSEFFQVLFGRIYGILSRAGKIPPAPEVLKGRKLVINYVSPLAKSQKAGIATAIRNAIQFPIEIVQTAPDVATAMLDNVDIDAAFREVCDLEGVPKDMLRSEKDVKGIREGRAQEAQAQAQAEQELMKAQALGQQAGALKDVAAAQGAIQ